MLQDPQGCCIACAFIPAKQQEFAIQAGLWSATVQTVQKALSLSSHAFGWLCTSLSAGMHGGAS